MFIKNAEPFYFPGNSIGCLLIHGFIGAPAEMRPVREFLSGKGYSIQGVRLSGHGTRMADLQRSHWQDWSGSVLDGISSNPQPRRSFWPVFQWVEH